MASRRVNPCLIKINRSYTARELADTLAVHKNTVRLWQREGLTSLDGGRPALFHGGTVRRFLTLRNAGRKRPCPAGTFYCFRCREPKRPAGGTVEYVARRANTGDLRGRCETCGTTMHRRARRAAISDVMPGIAVAIREGDQRLSDGPSPSLNCDNSEDC
jgi:hypothetical protein